MKLQWIGTLLLVLTGVLALASPPVTNPQGHEADASSVVWGGNDVSMEVTPQGARLEFDCAHGEILQAIKPDANGEFRVRGTYTPEHGGPILKDNPPRDLEAVYKGNIDGETMRLQILLNNKVQAPEPFLLTRGRVGRVRKCR